MITAVQTRRIKNVFSWLMLLGLLCFPMLLGQAQSPEGPVSVEGSRVRLEQVREHENAILRDVSSDGSSMILWTTHIPLLQFLTLFPSPENAEHKLIRVEMATGKVLGSIPVEWFPRSVRFFPDERRAIFNQGPGEAGTFKTLLWDFEMNQTEPCLDGRVAVEISDAIPVSGAELVAMRPRSSTISIPELVRMDARDCSIVETFLAYPEGEVANYGADLRLSPNRGFVAYSGRRNRLLRDVRDMSVVRRLESPEEWSFGSIRFMPDSQSLLVLMSRRIPQPDDPRPNRFTNQNWRRLRIYDIAEGSVIRELDISTASYGPPGGMAVSPDARLVAVGHHDYRNRFLRGREKQPILVIHDLMTGEELSRQEFPWGPDDISYGLTEIEFTADGQYLLTSTGDTQVWKIIRSDQ